MNQKIEKFIEYFTTITKEEADYLESILNWDSETIAAFRLAKMIFDYNDEE